MRRLFANIFIVILMGLASCAPAQMDQGSCSKKGEVCIKITTDEPGPPGKPFAVTLTISSQQDLSNLSVSLFPMPKTILVQKADVDETGVVSLEGQDGAYWIINIKAGEIVSFTRQVVLPEEDGFFDLRAMVSTPQLRAIDMVYFQQTRDSVKVYLSGTKIPPWEGPLPTVSESMKATVAALPSLTPWTTLTPAPATPEPSPLDASGTPAYPYP